MALLQSPTLQRLLLEARILLNQQNADNSTWSDAELTMYLNDGVRRYFAEVNERAEGLFDVQVDLDIVNGQETVALPVDCFEVKTVMKKVPTGFLMLRYSNNLTDNYESGGGSSSNVYQPYYYFRQNNLVLRPAPEFSETGGIRMEYTAFPQTMLDPTDGLTSQVNPIFRDVIVMYAVYKAKLREDLVTNSNTSEKAKAHFQELYQQFKESIGQRSKFPQFIKPFTPN